MSDAPNVESVWQTLQTAPAVHSGDIGTDPTPLLLCSEQEGPVIGYVMIRRDGSRRGMVGSWHGHEWTHWAPLPQRVGRSRS